MPASDGDAVAASVIVAAMNDVTTMVTSQNARELGHWIASIAAGVEQMVVNANSPLFFNQKCNDVPYGCTLNFTFGNVDDEATIRCEGLVVSFRSGEATPPGSALVGALGPNLIVVELGNSGGYNTSVTMDVEVAGPMVTRPGPLVTMRFEGNDPALTQRTRYFTFNFNVVPH